MDNLIELSEKLNASSKSQQRIDITGEVSYTGIAKTYRKHQIQIDLYKTFLSVTIYANSSLALAVNNQDLMFGYKVPFQVDNSPYPIYVSDDTGSFIKDDNVTDFLKDVLFLIKALEFSNAETAYFYNNGMRFVLSLERDIKAILDDFIDLISKHGALFQVKSKQRILKKNIPDDLILLYPFLIRYAIADDSKRAQLIEAMSEKKRKELIDVVSPLLAEINRYLDSFEDHPLSEEATLIGNLAELVMELIAGN